MDRHRAAVAAVVAQSHATIPAAFLSGKVAVDEAVAYARTATRQLRTLIGVPELMVQAIAGLRATFPDFFSTPTDDARGLRSRPAHVGVSVDVGTGLYVPVVPDADRLSLREIGDLLLRHRQAALRADFRPGQLAGASIMLALSNDTAQLSRPIVFPGQVCAISLGTTFAEPRRAPGDGHVRLASVACIGVAYDHRVLNGRPAAQFLAALAAALHRPGGTGADLT